MFTLLVLLPCLCRSFLSPVSILFLLFPYCLSPKHPSQWQFHAVSEKLVVKLENCPRLRSDRITGGDWGRVWVEVRVTLNYDLDLQSQDSYSHDPYTCKRSRSVGLKDGWTEVTALPPMLTWSVNTDAFICTQHSCYFTVHYR